MLSCENRTCSEFNLATRCCWLQVCSPMGRKSLQQQLFHHVTCTLNLSVVIVTDYWFTPSVPCSGVSQHVFALQGEVGASHASMDGREHNETIPQSSRLKNIFYPTALSTFSGAVTHCCSLLLLHMCFPSLALLTHPCPGQCSISYSCWEYYWSEPGSGGKWTRVGEL